MGTTIGLLLVFGFIVYAGYFRGWGWWSVAPLGALVTFIILLAMFDVDNNNLSGWIKWFANLTLFVVPTVAMVAYGKKGREDLAIWLEKAWVWTQSKRQ